MAILIGLEATFPDVAAFATIQNLILWVFVVEVVLKLLSEGRAPQVYFHNPWNSFDFIVTAVALVSLFGKTVIWSCEVFVVTWGLSVIRIGIIQRFYISPFSSATIDEVLQQSSHVKNNYRVSFESNSPDEIYCNNFWCVQLSFCCSWGCLVWWEWSTSFRFLKASASFAFHVSSQYSSASNRSNIFCFQNWNVTKLGKTYVFKHVWLR